MKTDNYCTFYLIRHGQTQWNVEKRLQGQHDSPLTAEGIKQAEGIREKLKHIHFDAIFSSDLYRAKHTAEVITLERELTIETSEMLRERNYGRSEGRSGKEIDENLKETLAKIEKLSVEEQWKTKLADDIESDEELAQRFTTYLREIAVVYADKAVLIITHSGALRIFLMHIGFAKKGDLKHGAVKNGGYIKVTSDGIDFFVKEVEGLQAPTASTTSE